MPKWRTPRGPQLRYCAKLALAAVVAYALTLGERNDYALFSVMGAALVMGGSVGEDLTLRLTASAEPWPVPSWEPPSRTCSACRSGRSALPLQCWHGYPSGWAGVSQRCGSGSRWRWLPVYACLPTPRNTVSGEC